MGEASAPMVVQEFFSLTCSHCGAFGRETWPQVKAELVQTGKVTSFPVVLFGSDYWGGLIDWLRSTVLTEGKIAERDLDLLHVTDDIDEVVAIIGVAMRAHRDDPPITDFYPPVEI